MKARYMKKILSVMLIVVMFLSSMPFSGQSVEAAPVKELQEEGISLKGIDTEGLLLAEPNKAATLASSETFYLEADEVAKIKQMQAEYKAVNEDVVVTGKYDSLPSLSNGVYQLGSIKASVHEKTTEQINFYRKLAGVKPVTWSEEESKVAQYGAIGVAATQVLTHNLDIDAIKPADMPDDFWTAAINGARWSNLYGWGSREVSLNEVQDAFIVDFGSNNKIVGHRAGIFSMNAVGVGFGYVHYNHSGISNYWGGTTMASDFWGVPARYDNDLIAHWPSAELFPFELYNVNNPWRAPWYQNTPSYEGNMRWSVHFNSRGYRFTDNIAVTLTNTETSVSTVMREDAKGGELTVDSRYGYDSIIFRPNNDYEIEKNVLYQVEITGLEKNGVPFNYTYHTRMVGMADDYQVKPDEYGIRYNANGGTGAPNAQTKIHDVNLTLSTTIPTREGHTFLGWSTSPTAVNVEYNAGSTYTANANATLYAVWKADNYTVMFDVNGGSGTVANQLKTHDVDLVLTATVPTREGYRFLGWSESSTAVTANYVAGGIYTTNAPVKLYAVWQQALISPSRILEVNVPIMVTAWGNGPREYYEFTAPKTGMYQIDGMHSIEVEIYDADENLICKGTGNVTQLLEADQKYYISLRNVSGTGSILHMLRVRDSHVVSLYASGGTISPATQVKYTGVDLLINVLPVKKDHIFLGWSTSPEAKEAEYGVTYRYTENKDLTLHAVWQRETVEVNVPKMVTAWSDGPRVHYEFTASKTGMYQIDGMHSIEVEIYDADENLIRKGTGNITQLLEADQKYYIGLRNVSGTGSILHMLRVRDSHVVSLDASGGTISPATQVKYTELIY